MTQKEKAIEYMSILGIDERLIDAYNETGNAILFDNGDVGVPLDEQTLNYANVYAKKIELEQNRGLLIYVILHETFSFGEIFDFLFVSNYSDDWDISISLTTIVLIKCWQRMLGTLARRIGVTWGAFLY